MVADFTQYLISRRDKQIHKMKVELKEKDEKLKDVVNMKVSESDKLEQLKVMLIKQYAEV